MPLTLNILSSTVNRRLIDYTFVTRLYYSHLNEINIVSKAVFEFHT